MNGGAINAMVRRQSVAALLCGVWIAAVAGCATAPEVELTPPFAFDETSPATGALAQWIDGGEPDLDAPVEAQELFVAGEILYWEGDLEGAYEYYVAMLRDHSGHALNRYAADRLRRMRHDVIDFSARITSDLDGVSFDDEGVLTRVELARILYDASRDLWRRSESEEPFEFRHAGAIRQWRATPVLSPWRLTDFDEPMSPESEARLASSYLSPQVAADDAANREATKVVSTQRLRGGLGLGRTGVYYLESQLTVEGDEAREVTVSGRFPGAARVWIGDAEVLDRSERAYESGRKLRQVVLEPGDHRVLVKLAYQPGARNWFELLFVPVSGPVVGDAGMRAGPTVEEPDAEVMVGEKTWEALELEPVRADGTDVAKLSSPTLYAAVISAYSSGDTAGFLDAHGELMERHPEFVAGHLLGSYHVRTRWDVPSQMRNSQALSRLRRAQELAPDNLHMLVQLERMLRDQGGEREHRRVLERARELALGDGVSVGEGASVATATSEEQRGASGGTKWEGPSVVRQSRPLVAWARHLERQGWSQQAEQAWDEVLELNSGHCIAARRLYGLYRSRQYFPPLEEVSDRWSSCPGLVDRWVRDHPDRLEQRREYARIQAQRYPYDATRQRIYAGVLRGLGEIDEAVRVLEEATERMPKQTQLWRALVELAMSDDDVSRARQVLAAATDAHGRSAEWELKKARLEDAFPLQGLMRDGKEAALDEVRRTATHDEMDEEKLAQRDRAMGLDDAYYVVDFAGREYFDDGSSWILTHQVVRVMTRGAIDRFAELSVPSGAYLLLARTIKEDGEVRMPEGVSGDSTLSMPGLAEGDMVELAYLQFRHPRRVASQISGNRFYFQMPSVSSRHSEYVVVGTEGVDFETANGAPEPEVFEWNGKQAARFVVHDSRHPRSEPRRVNRQEYLPWVREVRPGVKEPVLDMERRSHREALRGSARPSAMVDEKAESWLGRELDAGEVTDDEVRRLYYGVAQWFRRISPRSFRTDAAHAVEERRGSPIALLHLLFSQLGVEHDVYLARTDEEPPMEQAVGEIFRYSRALMRIEMPESGQVEWVQLQRRDAMFGALDPKVDGQKAVCVTCDEFRREKVSMDADKRPRRHIELEAELDEKGNLRGKLTYDFQGMRAVRVRSALRSRSDEEDRQSYFEQVLTDQISGADLEEVDVVGEKTPGEVLRFEMEFVRTGFARASGDRLVIDRPVFQEAMQRLYTRPPTRQTPMFVGYEREQSYAMRLVLPDGYDAELRAVDIDPETGATQYGDFQRRSWVDDGVLRLETSIRLPRQRITAGDYDEFRDWTRAVEESADLWLALRGASR